MKFISLFLLYILPLGYCFSQIEKSAAFLLYQGNVFAHTKDVENTAGSKPIGFEFQYRFKKLDSTFYKSFSGFPTQGFALGYANFNSPILGNGITASYFIAPQITINKWLQTEFNFNAGLAYLTKPNRVATNPNNQSYSTYLSAYLAIGLQANVSINDKVKVMAGITYRHTSNGGVKLPNKGVNWITNNVGIVYTPKPINNVKLLKEQYNKNQYIKKNFWEASLFGAVRSLTNESPVKFGIAGFQLQHNWQTAKTHAFNLGAEIFIDNALREQLQTEKNSSNIGLRSGVLIGHQFLWGRVHFGQQIGWHIHNPFKLFPNWYHRWTITHKISKPLSVGISLLAHKQIANFPDFRLIYRW